MPEERQNWGFLELSVGTESHEGYLSLIPLFLSSSAACLTEANMLTHQHGGDETNSSHWGC